MTVSSEMIYYIGLALIGFSILVAVAAVPVLILIIKRLKKQLETEYGKR